MNALCADKTAIAKPGNLMTRNDQILELLIRQLAYSVESDVSNVPVEFKRLLHRRANRRKIPDDFKSVQVSIINDRAE